MRCAVPQIYPDWLPWRKYTHNLYLSFRRKEGADRLLFNYLHNTVRAGRRGRGGPAGQTRACLLGCFPAYMACCWQRGSAIIQALCLRLQRVSLALL